MGLINVIASLVGWLFNLWGGLPESTKKMIIDALVNAFEATLRNFYRSTTSK